MVRRTLREFVKASGAAMALSMALLLVGCPREGPAESAGEALDRAGEDAEEAAGEAAEKAGDAIEDAADELEDATDR